jgi:predicted glutamine amidotransferase
MCRLSALTSLDMSTSMRRLIWHQLMLASNADGQRDGTGMTDGERMYKSHRPFLEYGEAWIAKLNIEEIWMGHVRAASRNTDITPLAAHPYSFITPQGSPLFAAHNGFITGMPEAEKGDPRVDSYTAFKMLLPLLSNGLTSEAVNAWTADFGEGSQWTFMFHHEKCLTIVRGQRTMYYMQLNDGLMFNTQLSVLLHIKEWLHTYWAHLFTCGKIEEMKEWTMATIKPEQTKVVTEKITAPTPPPDYANYYIRYEDNKSELIKQ